MSSRIFPIPEDRDWKKAYMAAVLEKERARLPALIQEANERLSERSRELWRLGPAPSEELEAIHDAFYLLQALLSSLAYRDEPGEWNDVA